jgi:hypothetical protein
VYTEEQKEELARRLQDLNRPPEFVRKPFTAAEHDEMGRQLTETLALLRRLSKQLRRRYGEGMMGPAFHAERAAVELSNFVSAMADEWALDMATEPGGLACPYKQDATKKGHKRGAK